MAVIAEPGRQIHATPHGDRWRLLRKPADERCFVRYTGNTASGWPRLPDVALVTFLAADRGGPEHWALSELIGDLVENDPMVPSATA